MAWENLPSTSTPINATNLNKITDSGSNTNGYYLKFQDGTLIQWNESTTTDQAISNQYGNSVLYFGSRTIEFPIEFYDTHYSFTVGKAVWGTSGSWGSQTSVQQKARVSIYIYDMFSRASGTNFYLSWLAIGKWK